MTDIPDAEFPDDPTLVSDVSRIRQIGQANSIVGHSNGRKKLDFYPTPPEATRALIRNETFFGDILEPACGTGWMSEVLKETGLPVVSRDIVDYGYADGESGHDFLESDIPEGAFSNVVTNPPFIQAQAFVEKGLHVAKRKVAMFLKFAFAEGLSRREFFRRTPLAHVYVFSDRVQLTRDGVSMKEGGMICFAWYVWDKEHDPRIAPSMYWLNSKEYRDG